MRKEDQDRLRRIVEKVHGNGKRIRFWALPDREKGWNVAYRAGVDLINTDKLRQLREHIESIEKGP